MLAHLGAMVRWCHDAAVRWWPTVRVALASYWTVGISLVIMSWLHWRWLWRQAHGGEVLAAYGAALVVFGLWVAVLELMRVGVAETARRQAEPNFAWFGEQMAGVRAAQKATEARARRVLIVERIGAGLIAAAGTLLSGWAAPLARRWGLPV